MIQMKIISEKEIIKLVSENINFREEIVVPVGEDASVFFPKQDCNIVATTDSMVLNTHFSSDISPFELGYIAAASNVSDLSAMGANPALALINLTIEEPSKEYIENLIQGYNKVFKKYPVSVIGGDTTYGPQNISMTLIGYTNHNNFMVTSNAKVGDIIFISGPIGESFLARKNKSYHLPEIRNTLGVLLPEYANCCTDMSDGILESVNNISKKSHVGVKINIDKIPRNEELDLLISNKKITWEDIFNYGEDYELIFTVKKENVKILKNVCSNIGLDIYEIGKIIGNNEIEFYLNNKLADISNKEKFEHFKL